MENENVEQSSKVEEIPNCKVCSLPLGMPEISNNRQWHYACVVCEHCGEGITEQILHKWLKGDGPRAHSTCDETYTFEVLAQRPVTITQGTLDRLNKFASLGSANMNRNIEDNEMDAEIAMHQLYNHVKSVDELYVIVKKYQRATVVASLLLRKVQDDMNVDVRIQAQQDERKRRDNAKMSEVTNQRVSAQRALEIKREKKTPTGATIATFKKMGFSDEKAREMLAQAKAQAARERVTGESE